MAKGKVLQTVINISGEISPTLGKSLDAVTKRMEGLNGKGLAVGAAIGTVAIGTGIAVAKAGKYLLELGTSFDGATDAIRIGTGATGEALEGLQADFDAVYSSVPTSMENAGQAIADYNTRLGLTGPQLQEISKQALQVSDMLGEDLSGVIQESSQAFQQWNIDSDDMSSAMDHVFKVSQSTGTGFTALLENTQKFGPQLQEMGYSFESATALIGQLDKAGVNTEEVLGAMKKSVVALAKDGISASDGLTMYYEKIQNAGSAAEAAAIASEVFGSKAGSTMAAAIRDGTLSVSDFTAELAANGETIQGAAEDTYDFADRLAIMKQDLEVALKPLANTVFDGLNKFMPVLQKLMEKIVPVISKAAEAAMPFVDDFLMGAAGLLEELIPMLSDLSEDIFPIFSDLIANLLPPVLDLARALLPPLMQIVTAILPPIASVLSAILPLMTQIISTIMPVFNQLINALLPIITPILDITTQLLNDVIMPLLPPLLQIVQSILPLVTSLLTPILPILKSIAPAISAIASALGTVVGWIAKVVEWVSSGLGWVVDLVTGKAKAGKVEGFATGGFTDGVSIAGEDPRYPTEAIISFNPAYRAQNLSYWAQAGRMLGIDAADYTFAGSSSGTSIELGGITFAPQITVNGNADKQSIMEAIEAEYPEFIDMLEDWFAKRGVGTYV
ncbi:MAG: phage tail tape measure protein [Clostridiales bacterium]|nr:phage tail tape measure protein [Clostridiales bacterium]